MRNWSVLHPSSTPDKKIGRYIAYFSCTESPFTVVSKDPFFSFQILDASKKQAKVTFKKKVKSIVGISLMPFETEVPKEASQPVITTWTGCTKPIWGDLAKDSYGYFTFTLAFARPIAYSGLSVPDYIMVEILAEG